MEQQAKERLTGAGILVAVLVLLVPELLTGPRAVLPALPAQPDQAPMRSYTMDLGESPHTNSAPVAASTATPTVGESPAPSSAPVAIPSAPRPVAVPPPVAVQPPVAAATAVPRAIAHSGTEHSGTEHSSGSWAVQLGTFGSRDNAARLVTALKSHGFSASLSEVTKSGHKLFRVRVGAEHDRAAAMKLQARLKAAGEKGGEIVSR